MSEASKHVWISTIVAVTIIGFMLSIAVIAKGCSSTAEVHCPNGLTAVYEEGGSDGGWIYDASEVEAICEENNG